MGSRDTWRAVGAIVAVLWLGAAAVPAGAEDILKLAIGQRGNWNTSIVELGNRAGIFKKHGLALEMLYTAGGGETQQAVIAGAVDIGTAIGTMGALGAYAKGAPMRIIAAETTGGADYWYVAATSPIKTLRDTDGKTIAFSTVGASTHGVVLAFVKELGLKAKPVATGGPVPTLTQVMTGQIDVGWAVAPFGLDALDQGEIRLVARASDIAAIREQTIRVQVTNTRTLTERKNLVQRFREGYRETLDWMYASPETVPRYMAYSGFSENAVRRMMSEFIPKQSLQLDEIKGINESMADAIQFKFISRPLSEEQVKALIQVPGP
jgi:NitT/TauT family transport system substrate-binding protein